MTIIFITTHVCICLFPCPYQTHCFSNVKKKNRLAVKIMSLFDRFNSRKIFLINTPLNWKIVRFVINVALSQTVPYS